MKHRYGYEYRYGYDVGRYLRHLGYEVNYVCNFTDVDDKIIARASELGEDPIGLNRCYCEEFHQDMTHLHCLCPSVERRMFEHMPQIIDMIKQILDNGCAYRIEDVYFSVDKFPDYGQLSGQKLEDNRAGERVAEDLRKENPADFALWKSSICSYLCMCIYISCYTSNHPNLQKLIASVHRSDF
ncbi:hypothetical protein ACSBR1_040704 [Camellia fascicularis]